MLRELFAENRNIIINTDIDGILSGALLVKYCDCQVVGFTNSKDKVWLAKGYDDLYKHVYVDMFVTDDRAICLDQHIVAVSEEHQERIRKSGNKYSPQIDGNKIFTPKDYEEKYPFGTTQYIIAALEEEGIRVELPDLNTPIENSEITVGDLIHRADDAMRSTIFKYIKNANYWWDWLLKKSNNSEVIRNLIQYLRNLNNEITTKIYNENPGIDAKKRYQIVEDEIKAIKAKTKKYFEKNFACTHSDGGFDDVTDGKGEILPNIYKYVNTVFSLLGCKGYDIPTRYCIHKGTYCRTRWLPIFEKDFMDGYMICGHKIFSYAFIFGPGSDSSINFSFTIDMK